MLTCTKKFFKWHNRNWFECTYDQTKPSNKFCLKMGQYPGIVEKKKFTKRTIVDNLELNFYMDKFYFCLKINI